MYSIIIRLKICTLLIFLFVAVFGPGCGKGGGTDSGSSLDNTVVSLVFMQQPTDTSADNQFSPDISVKALNAAGSGIAGITLTLTVETTLGDPAPAGFFNGTTITPTDAAGIATFANVRLSAAGAYVLRAAAGAISKTSSAFVITAGAPYKVSFFIQPTDTPINTFFAPSVRVIILDFAENPVTNAANLISLSAVGTTLNGDVNNIVPVDGIATFNAVAVGSSPVTPCGLIATASPFLISASSEPFAVLAEPAPVYTGRGGGGGAGGSIVLIVNSLTNSGTISANGGGAGTASTYGSYYLGGGAGGGGRSYLQYTTKSGSDPVPNGTYYEILGP